jgi:hypothetical protein
MLLRDLEAEVVMRDIVNWVNNQNNGARTVSN